MIVIVPSHNQASNIKEIVEAYEAQTIKPEVLLFVLDRCTDNSEEILNSINTSIELKWIIKIEGCNFSAGMTRDYGLRYIEANYKDYDCVLFTDGDCIPTNNVIENHIKTLSQTKKHAVSCGRRLMQLESGSCEEYDERDEWAYGMSFTNKNARLIIANYLTTDSILTYSCNLAFNRKAIDVIKSINYKLTNNYRLFNSSFDGVWGGEDCFVSYCIYKTNGYILLCSKDSYVKHAYHKSSIKDLYAMKEKLKELSNELTNLIFNNEICGFIENVDYYDYRVFSSNYIEMLEKIECIKTIYSYLNTNIDETIFGYFTSSNLKYNVIGKNERKQRYNQIDILNIRREIGLMQFYLENDTIIFEKSNEQFEDTNNINKKCSYCNLRINT